MRLIAEAGTDGAMVALFDPAVLPEEFDQAYQETPVEVLESLQEEGKLFFTETGGDGGFLLHLYLDEEVPERIAAHCSDAREQGLETSGVLWFAGAEYVYRTDDHMMRKWPGMGARIELPAGRYRAAFWRTEYPEGFVEQQARAAVGESGRAFSRSPGCLIGGGLLLLVIGGIAALARQPLVGGICAGLGLALWIGGYFLYRSPRFQEATRRSEEVYADWPAIVGRLKREAAQEEGA